MSGNIENTGFFGGCGNNFFSFIFLIIILCCIFGSKRRCGCGREFCNCKI